MGYPFSCRQSLCLVNLFPKSSTFGWYILGNYKCVTNTRRDGRKWKERKGSKVGMGLWKKLFGSWSFVQTKYQNHTSKRVLKLIQGWTGRRWAFQDSGMLEPKILLMCNWALTLLSPSQDENMALLLMN